MRIQLTLARNGSKLVVLISTICAIIKVEATGEEGTPQFSSGAQVLLLGGHTIKVREFVSVVDFLIARATDQSVAQGYFTKEDPKADEEYAKFQKASGRNAPPVQTADEIAAQDADQPELAAVGGKSVF